MTTPNPLIKYLEEKWTVAIHRRQMREARWFLNCEYVRGRQWLMVNEARQVVNRPVPSVDFPRAVTNRVGQIVGDLENFVVQSQLPLINQPGSDEQSDVDTAAALDRFDDVLYEEAQVRLKQRTAAAWLIPTGNVFLVPYYDYGTDWGTRPVSMLRCPACQLELPDGDERVAEATAQLQLPPELNVAACPACATQGLPSPMEPFETEVPIGKLCTDVCSPFEILFDNSIPYGQPRQWFFRRRRYPIEKARELWPDFANQIKEGMHDVGSPTSVDYQEALAYVEGSVSRSASGTDPRTKSVTVLEFYELPCADYPQGLRAVQVGKDLIVEEGELPFKYKVGQRKGQCWLPLIHIGDIIRAGSAWCGSRVDDLIAPQTRRNIVESLMQQTFQRTGGPKLLVPNGAGIQNVVGDAGQQLNYRPISIGSASAFAKPEYLEGSLGNLQSIVVWMQMIDDTMEQLAGTRWLTGGEAPSGVTAACLEETTECLTRRGWMTPDKLLYDDEIYTFNPSNGLGEWSKPLRINRYEYTGRVYAVDGFQVKALMTPNHAWCVGSKNENSHKYWSKHRDKKRGHILEKRRADFGTKHKKEKYSRVLSTELKAHHYIPLTAPLAAVAAGGTYTNEFVQFCGWLFTEGSYDCRKAGRIVNDKRGSYTSRTDSWTVSISQSGRVNPKECDLIRKCLTKCGFRWREKKPDKNGVIAFRIHGKAARVIVKQFPDKIPTLEFIHALSQTQLKLLVDTMLLGDGHEAAYREGRKHHTRVFASADPELVNLFQMIAALAGYSTSCAKKYTGAAKHRKPRYSDFMYRCSIKTHKRAKLESLLKRFKETIFSGNVWCPTTENGTWLARQDGCVFVTGNSGLALLDERATRALRKLKEQWVEGWREWKLLAIELMREHMTDERILTVLGRNKQWQTQSFKQADLQGAVNVRVDYEALFPKSEATKRATMAESVQMGIVDPRNPETQYGYLQEVGMTKLLGSGDDAKQQAIREFDRFMVDPLYVPKLLPGIQDSTTHLIQHKKDAMSQEFELLMEKDEQRAEVWLNHILATQTDVFAAQIAIGAPAAGGAPSDQQGAIAESMTAGDEPAAVEKGRAVVQRNDQRPPEEAVPAEVGFSPS